MKKISVLSLLILLSCAQVSADDLNDEEIFAKFISHVKQVYMTNAKPALFNLDYRFPFGDTEISARLLGYSLGNLLLHARRGSENYRVLLMLEKKTKDTMVLQLEKARREVNFPRSILEKRKQEVLQDFMQAQQGWHDTDMARLTNIKGRDAPDFFASLATISPDPSIPPTSTDQSTPPIQQTPPSGTLWDEVGGTYKVIGQLWENDPSCGSSVILKGSMTELETEFKLWDRTGVTWHYKGNVVWDGKQFAVKPLTLTGGTYNVKYPQQKHGLTAKIKLGEDKTWRAFYINIGGNSFNLQQTQSSGRKKVVKILTVKNSTAKQITVFLELGQGRNPRKLGWINANASRSFTDIPGIGRWYLSIDYTSEGGHNPHRFTLYIKEQQFLYFIEVKPEHFR